MAPQAATEEEEEEAEETDWEEEDPGKAGDYQELLDAINEAREQGNRLDDQILTRLFRDWLHSKPCQNQGFILDGYPKTIDQAKELFSGKLTDQMFRVTTAGIPGNIRSFYSSHGNVRKRKWPQVSYRNARGKYCRENCLLLLI